MAYKIVDRATAYQLSAAQIVGRRCVHGRDWKATTPDPNAVGMITRTSVMSNSAVYVTWDNGLAGDHAWGYKNRYAIDLIDDGQSSWTPKDTEQAIGRAKRGKPIDPELEREAKMHFGKPDTSDHPLLRLRDRRKKL